ncbi:MAG: hypothetical protein ACI9W2_002290 [Gammaproteobacteria bacterium]|jgi:hypothetical protein
MGYSHADSLSLTRAVMLIGTHGFYRRRFDLFAIKRDASQSWWIVPLRLLRLRRVAYAGDPNWVSPASKFGSYTLSLCTIAHATRAVLFASATVTTLACLRARSAFSH